MAANRTTFEKLQRDRAKKAKAAAKRDKRLGKSPIEAPAEEAPAPVPTSKGGELSPAELLRAVETLHRDYADKKIDLETFEERKADLMARLPID
ncbi:MAG: hypothetical protein GY929_11585 [Actinomycetia bacterium]|nr:hypothetical protein [Actinomycetes bacterium]